MVCQLIRKYQRIYDYVGDVIQYSGKLEYNTLYVILINDHFFLLYHTQVASWLADGANACYDQSTYESLVRYLGLSVSPRRIRYQGQLGYHHCGSSAVLIGLAMLGEARKGWMGGGPSILMGPRTLRRRLIGMLHREPDEGMGLQSQVGRLGWQKCRGCGRSFRTKDRRGLAQHERACLSSE